MREPRLSMEERDKLLKIKKNKQLEKLEKQKAYWSNVNNNNYKNRTDYNLEI